LVKSRMENMQKLTEKPVKKEPVQFEGKKGRRG